MPADCRQRKKFDTQLLSNVVWLEPCVLLRLEVSAQWQQAEVDNIGDGPLIFKTQHNSGICHQRKIPQAFWNELSCALA